MNRPLYIRALAAAVLILAAISASAQSAPRDRNCFHHRHFNLGGVCLLSSYGFLLEYANSSDEHIADFDNFDMMANYMKFHNIDEPCPQHTASFFRKNQITTEKDLSKAINGYCMERRWSGYIRVLQFHDWLKQNTKWADNIELVKRMPSTLNNNGQPVANSYADLASYLERNSDRNAEYDYAALICYSTPSGPHSVFLGYDQDYFIRDVNHYDRFVDRSCSFDFTYGPDADVLEYAIFKVKRRPYAAKEWKHYQEATLRASVKAADDFMKLDKPVPVKHLRVTANANGSDGTPYYTVIKIRSFSDPDLEIAYGNYYNMPSLNINGKYEAIGHRTANGVFEFDLGQISDDLYIWGYQQNFNFEGFAYQ